MRWMIVAIVPVVLAGCAFPRTMANIAIDQNEMVARTTDQMTLLNILRAKDDRPLHFTSISRVTGNIRASISTGGSARVGGGDTPTLFPDLGADISTSPSYDLTIYDSQDFQKGILQPITPTTLNYYLRTGWRPDLVTTLAVSKIEFIAAARIELPPGPDGRPNVVEAAQPVATLFNSPTDPVLAAQFQRFVGCYTLSAARRSGVDKQLKRMADVTSGSLADLAQLDGRKLEMAKIDGEDWVVRPGSDSEAVRLARDHSRDDGADPARCNALPVQLAGNSGVAATVSLPVGTTTAVVRFGANGTSRSVDSQVDITLRSVDGLIYFLGEYARSAIDAPQPVYRIAANGTLEPLLVIRRGRGQRHDLGAELNGFSYHIPRDGAGRSYEVLTLVEQLFNLNKTGQAAPLSTAVRVIN